MSPRASRTATTSGQRRRRAGPAVAFAARPVEGPTGPRGAPAPPAPGRPVTDSVGAGDPTAEVPTGRAWPPALAPAEAPAAPTTAAAPIAAAAPAPVPPGVVAPVAGTAPAASEATATPAAAAAAGAPAAPAPSPPSPPAASASSRSASYSGTVANTGIPAVAASARVDASGATMARRRLRPAASWASRRKLIRLVAIREPAGRTSATSRSVAVRIRAAAVVISSSTSR